MPPENKGSFIFYFNIHILIISGSCLIALSSDLFHVCLGNSPITTLEILSYGASGFSNSLPANPGPKGRKLLTSLSSCPHWWVRIKSLEGPHGKYGEDPALHSEVTPGQRSLWLLPFLCLRTCFYLAPSHGVPAGCGFGSLRWVGQEGLAGGPRPWADLGCPLASGAVHVLRSGLRA